MSELKERMLGQTMNEYGCDTKIYLKSEADNVIAKLKNEIETQKRLRDMALASVPNVLKVMKIIQHQKYKRCLAMAKACDKYAFALELQGQGRSTELLKRHNRAIERKYKWLAIADKFKELDK